MSVSASVPKGAQEEFGCTSVLPPSHGPASRGALRMQPFIAIIMLAFSLGPACGGGGTTNTGSGGSGSSSSSLGVAPSTTSTTSSRGVSPTVARAVQVTNLKDGDLVDYIQEVRGTALGLPTGVDLWIMIQPLLSPRYHPQPGPVARSSDGQFISVGYFGESALKTPGEKFILMVVVASSDGSRVIRDYLDGTKRTGSYPGLATLPTGSEPAAQVSVTRK
jgi:hypothetical protein